MGTKWAVTALILGHHLIKKKIFFPGCDESEEFWVPVTAAALSDGVHCIVVDTGHHDTNWVCRHMSPATCTPQEHLLTALRSELGWAPEDVDIVINTHLHFNHCGNNSKFPNARFVTHRREWAAACQPPAGQENLYLPSLYGPEAVAPERWQFVDRDTQFLDGLRLIETPGHSAGHISVLVETEEGVLCVAGDMCCTLRNLQEGIVGSSAYSPEQTTASYEKVRHLAQRVLPGHDSCIRPFQHTQFPLI